VTVVNVVELSGVTVSYSNPVCVNEVAGLFLFMVVVLWSCFSPACVNHVVFFCSWWWACIMAFLSANRLFSRNCSILAEGISGVILHTLLCCSCNCMTVIDISYSRPSLRRLMAC